MTEHNAIIETLSGKGVKPTANRILVYEALCHAERPMSLASLEEGLVYMDKSSIFRVLTLFQEHDVVHAFQDGRGVLQYEICHERGECHHHDWHAHFYCQRCQRSFCLEDIQIPEVTLPAGFQSHSISFVIKGICQDCQGKPE